MSLLTARIPELSPLTVDLPLSLADLIPIWVASENKTKKVSLQALNTFFNTGGGGGSHAPVVYLGELIYEVPLAADGTQIAYIPELAGKDFTLERSGIPLKPLLPDGSNAATAEYDVLDAGGFQLLQTGDVLHLNERFKLSIYSLIGSTSTGTSGTSSFIKGKKTVIANETLDPVTDMNKIIQIRGGSNSITLTIPNVGDIPVNSFIPIETTINNTKPSNITTTGGQFIYLNNESKNTLHMMPGESMWLFRDTDGLYVINDFSSIYRNIGGPTSAYKVGLNQLICKGQTVNRIDQPRLWEYVQTLGSSLVSDTLWNTANVYRQGNTYYTSPPVGTYSTISRPYRGCFSTGDGSTTFRLPDLMNMSLRGVKSETGSDNERYINKPGGYQDGVNKKFWSGDLDKPVILQVDGSNTEIGTDTVGPTSPNIRVAVDIDKNAFGVEVRMENTGVLWVMNG